jgi:hypothetical protein
MHIFKYTKPFQKYTCCWFIINLLIPSCTTLENPPNNTNSLCAIFAEKPAWRTAALAASKRWDVPISVLLAFMYYESGFQADAKPITSHGIFWDSTASSAFGYSQALDGTWKDYQKKTGSSANRTDFSASVDFMAWYLHTIAFKLNISLFDAYHLYLAYHQGPANFIKQTYANKSWLKDYATKVQNKVIAYLLETPNCLPH